MVRRLSLNTIDVTLIDGPLENTHAHLGGMIGSWGVKRLFPSKRYSRVQAFPEINTSMARTRNILICWAELNSRWHTPRFSSEKKK